MKLALVGGSPRASTLKATEKYCREVVQGVAAVSGFAVEHEIIWAVEREFPKDPPVKVIREERDGLIDRLVRSNPDVVVSMGAAALTALSPVPTSLKKEHGRMRWLDLCRDEECLVYKPWTPTVAAWQVIVSPDLHRDFANVVYKAVTQWAPLEPTQIETVVCRTAEDLQTALLELEDATVIGLDVETTGLVGYADDLTAVGFGAVSYDGAYGYAVVVPQDALAAPGVVDVMWDAAWRSTRRSVGHNFKFDQQFLAPLLGWSPRGALLGDTLLLAHLLDERPTRPSSRARGSSLKDLVAQRYDHEYGFDFGKPYADLDEEERQALYEYLGQDVVYTARLWHDLEREAREEGGRLVEAHDELLMPVSRAIAQAEYVGAPVDSAWVAAEVSRLSTQIAHDELTLAAILPPIALTGDSVTNLGSAAQIAAVVYSEWGAPGNLVKRHGHASDGDRSTDQDHVKAIVVWLRKKGDLLSLERAEWLEGLVAYRKAVKLRTTYQQSLVDRVDGADRVHPSFLLHGAATGRISAREPAIQTIPAVDDIDDSGPVRRYKLRDQTWTEKPMRRAFAAPDRVIVEVDYSQLELRVAAGISGDKAFGDVFRSKRDVHREVAAAIFSKPPDEVSKPERYLAKAVSFGILYGRTAKALAEGDEMTYAVNELGMERWTADKAELFIRKFLRSYPDLEAWISRVHREAPLDGYVESPRGRRRRFPLVSDRGLGSIERQAVNTPVQGEASDICLDSFWQLTGEVERLGIRATVLFPVHDSIVLECDPADVGKLRDLCKDIMEVAFMGVPLAVDFEWGESWADVRKHDDLPRLGEAGSGGSR